MGVRRRCLPGVAAPGRLSAGRTPPTRTSRCRMPSSWPSHFHPAVSRLRLSTGARTRPRFGDLDSSLRSALSEGLSEALDAKVVAQIVSDVGRTDATAEFEFATYRSQLVYSRLDGRFAKTESDVRILMGAATSVHASSEYRGNNADDSAIDSLRRISGGVRISAHIAGVSGNKQDALVRRGSGDDAVAAMWPGVSILVDEITASKTGKIIITGVLLSAFKVLRTDGFARIQTQHVA